jgi:hypothetical protein
MAHISPTLEGFRAAFRRPSLTLAEIAWRWTVGGVAGTLVLFGVIEYLDTLTVNPVDAALLRTKQPLVVGRAITHILRGSLNRAVLAALFAALALLLLWITAASLGRSITIRALLDQLRGRLSHRASSDIPTSSTSLHSLIALNFLRAAAALAAIFAFLGAAILASFASPEPNPQLGLSFIILVLLAAVICVAWAILNWMLSLACVFAVRDGEDALGALSAAVSFLRERTAPVFAVSTWTGLAHLTALFVASTMASVPAAFVHIAPTRLIVAAVVLVTLTYFAVVDWLYIARLVGYICIVEMPDAVASAEPLPVPPPVGQGLVPSTPIQTTIDRDELILADVPLPALET